MAPGTLAHEGTSVGVALIILQALLAMGIGAVFVASAIPKLRHPRGFVLAVMEYRLLPPRASWIVGRMVPPLELLVGLLLASGAVLPAAAAAAMALLLSFLFGIGVNLARGRDLDCHCFGNARKRVIGWRVIVEDAGLLVASAVLMLSSVASGHENALAAWSPWRLLLFARLPVGPAVVALSALAVAVVVITLALNPVPAPHHATATKAK